MGHIWNSSENSLCAQRSLPGGAYHYQMFHYQMPIIKPGLYAYKASILASFPIPLPKLLDREICMNSSEDSALHLKKSIGLIKLRSLKSLNWVAEWIWWMKIFLALLMYVDLKKGSTVVNSDYSSCCLLNVAHLITLEDFCFRATPIWCSGVTPG